MSGYRDREVTRDPDPIRAQLRSARHEAGLSLMDVEEKFGLNAVRIGSWERGDRNPGSIAAFRQWAEAFGRKLVVLEPHEAVISTVDVEDVDEFVEYAVQTSVGKLPMATRGAAEAFAAQFPGAQIIYRTVRRTVWVSAGGVS